MCKMNTFGVLNCKTTFAVVCNYSQTDKVL